MSIAELWILQPVQRSLCLDDPLPVLVAGPSIASKGLDPHRGKAGLERSPDLFSAWRCSSSLSSDVRAVEALSLSEPSHGSASAGFCCSASQARAASASLPLSLPVAAGPPAALA